MRKSCHLSTRRCSSLKPWPKNCNSLPHLNQSAIGLCTHSPSWLHVVCVTASLSPVVAADLDPGERDAILLALNVKADLVIMDDREGVEEAHRLGLTVTGTIGVLDRAAERSLIDLESAVASLRQTNFRIAPSLLDQLLAADRG